MHHHPDIDAAAQKIDATRAAVRCLSLSYLGARFEPRATGLAGTGRLAHRWDESISSVHPLRMAASLASAALVMLFVHLVLGDLCGHTRSESLAAALTLKQGLAGPRRRWPVKFKVWLAVAQVATHRLLVLIPMIAKMALAQESPKVISILGAF